MKKSKLIMTFLCAIALLGVATTLTSCKDDTDDPIIEPEGQKCIVTIDLNDGSTPTTKEVVKGKKLSGVSDPTRVDYIFAGWKVNGIDWTMDEVITGDITIVAQWNPVERFTVTIDLNDGSTPTTKEVVKGEKLSGVSNPTRVDYIFDGWKVNGIDWTMDEVITSDITIVAQWKAKENIQYCFVTLDLNNGSEPQIKEVAKGEVLTGIEDPTKADYLFIGWYRDEKLQTKWDMSKDVVTADIILYAGWSIMISQTAVESLQTAIKVDGSYVYTSEKFGEDKAGIITIFEPTSVKTIEYDLITHEQLYLQEFVDYNGNCAFVKHSVQNVVSYQDLQEPFDEYDNPFKDLKRTDFLQVKDQVFAVRDDGVGNLKAIASCVTGWSEDIKSILVTVKEDKIVHIVIETNVMSKKVTIDDAEATDYYSVVYTFDVKDHGVAKTDIITDPYERVLEHDLLEEALKKMNHNHTIHCLDVSPGYEDVSYDILVTDTATYDTYIEKDDKTNIESSYGYIELDGYVYQFRYSNRMVTVGDPFYKGSIMVTSSNFTAFKPEVMQYIGNNVFRAYNADLAKEILSYIGPDYDRQRLGAYASYVELEIKDGSVYRVTFGYSAYGAIGTLTMIYDAFDETTIDIDFSNIEHVSVLDPYKGTWKTTEANGHTIVVNDSGIFVDDAEYIVTSHDIQGFIGTIDGETYYLMKWTERELLLYNTDRTVFWIFTKEGAVQEFITIPDTLKGVWQTKEQNLKIVIQTHAVFVNGMPVDLVYYSENGDMLTVSYNGGYYYLFTKLDDKTNINYLYFARNDLSDSHQLVLTTESIGVEIPSSYIGIWENKTDDIRIVIRFSGITINGRTYTITSYSNVNGFVGVLGEETNYMIAPYFTSDKLQVGTMSNNSIVTKISDDPSDEDTRIYEEHIGYYEGVTDDGQTYTLNITKNGILLNGKEFVITQSTEDTYDGLWEDEVWYLVYTYDNSMEVFNSDCSIYIKCALITPKIIVDSAHVGTYVGTHQDVEYHIVISLDGIFINDIEANLTAYDKDLKEYEGNWNGVEIFLSYYTGDVPFVFLMASNPAIMAKCTLVTTPVEVEVQAEHIGTYVGVKDDVTYTIVVSADGITVNGNSYTLTAYSAEEGYTGIWQEEEYLLSYMEGYDPVMMMFANPNYSFVVNCKLSTSVVDPVEVEIKEEHVGTYVGTNDDVTYTIVVTTDGITINDEVVELTGFVSEDYEEYYTINWHEGSYKLSYVGAWGAYPAQFILSNDTLEITCDIQNTNPTAPEVQTEHIGTYVGVNDEVTYTIVITADGITINGSPYTLTDYSDYEGYTGSWNEQEWYIGYYQASGTAEPYMMLMNSNLTIRVQCNLTN